MKNLKISLLLTAFAAACYTPGARAAYDDVGVGARVTGMGNAFTAVADDVYSVYYNPAGLGTLDRTQLATTYSRLYMGLSDNSNLQNSFMAFTTPLRGGRQGSLGMAWNHFALAGLYRETSLYGSYGRRLFAERFPNGLYAGLSLKYLSRSIGKSEAADNAFNDTGAAQQGVQDPVLQSGSKSNMDVDLGLVYRAAPRLTVGLSAQHLFEPNIAFSASDSDKLGRNVKLGGAYQTPWTTFSGELGFIKAPDASTDKVFTLAAEKWLPTLLYGSFGVRGAFGLGDRDYRSVSMGLSYRVNRMQVDYSFAMPLGTISNTYGTHRMGLSFLFGRPRGAEPRLSEAILENMRDLASVGTPEFRAQAEEIALYKRTAQQEFLRQARVDTGEARFAEAMEKLSQALGMNPKDLSIQASLERMTKVAEIMPKLDNFRADAAQAAVYEGVMDYLAGRSKDSVRKLAYAQSIQPADEAIENLLRLVEAETGLQRELPTAAGPAPTLGVEKEVGAALALMEVSLREADYARVLQLADKVLALAPENVLALKRKATAHYALKQYPEALRALRAAHKAEPEGTERARLKSYIDAMASLIERKTEEGRKPVAAPEKPSKPLPVDIQRMYEAGVDLYAQGRLSESANMFQSILRLDPKNKSAQAALRRVQAEVLQPR